MEAECGIPEGKKLLETQSEEGTVVPWSLHLPDSNGEDPRGAPYHFGRWKERLIIVKYIQTAPLLGKDHQSLTLLGKGPVLGPEIFLLHGVEVPDGGWQGI